MLDPFVPHAGEMSATVFGYQMRLDLSWTVQRDVYIGNYEPAETKLLRSSLKPGMTALDIGANVGYYTALAATTVGNTVGYSRSSRIRRISTGSRLGFAPIMSCRPAPLTLASGAPQGRHKCSLNSQVQTTRSWCRTIRRPQLRQSNFGRLIRVLMNGS